ncbi:hypothetical protein [uncultured Amnibacterium sp.]|uniref:hypothetical protein n=1 Tax=uncultured Amnibacterium sp. TaxID=1631851 RepID=UPI0035CBC177
MKQLLPVIAAGAAAAALVLAPALTASAEPVRVAAKASTHYTLTVDGNGDRATVAWARATVKDISATPTMHTVRAAKEPWTKRLKVGADLYEVVAVQTTGSRLTCTIKDPKGAIIARSSSHGKNTIVTCIAATEAGLAGPSSGSTAG